MLHSGTVYLLHFARPLGNQHNPRALAQHYLGWATNLGERLNAHAAGRGAALTRAALAQGIGWECVATWDGDWTLEKKIKRLKAAPRICPICGRKHPHGQIHVHVDAQQLALPLWDEWPAMPAAYNRMSWQEWHYLRTRPIARFGQLDLDTSWCDIPL